MVKGVIFSGASCLYDFGGRRGSYHTRLEGGPVEITSLRGAPLPRISQPAWLAAGSASFVSFIHFLVSSVVFSSLLFGHLAGCVVRVLYGAT